MKLFKRTALGVLKYSGVFHAMSKSRWRDERLLILCFHGISLEDEHQWWPAVNITASVFESRLKILRDGGYNVLPLEDAVTKLYAGTLPRKSVVITFDDGMYNFYTKAFPLLQKYGFPSTLYLTTYYSDHQMPVFPLICSYMLWKKSGALLPANPSLGFDGPLDLQTPTALAHSEKVLRAYVEKMKLNANQKNEFAKRLADHLDLDFDEFVSKRMFHLVTPDEVRELSQKGVDIQLHTHRHHSPLDRTLFHEEIVTNRNSIKAMTGLEVRHHCYPSGFYRNEFLPWLSELAVTSATTCDHGLAHQKSDPLLLPRFLDSSNIFPLEFEGWLTGVAGLLRQTLHGK